MMSAVHTLFLTIIILSYLGYYLDKKMDTFPIVFLLSLIFGLFLGFYQLIRITNMKKK